MPAIVGEPPERPLRGTPRGSGRRAPARNPLMATTSLRGNTVTTVGDLPAVGSTAPSYTLAGADLSDVSSEDFAGHRVVLNIFPSVDTGVCAASVRRFNELAAGLEDTTVVCVSADLPFALKRFCGAEGIERVVAASSFRSGFGTD